MKRYISVRILLAVVLGVGLATCATLRFCAQSSGQKWFTQNRQFIVAIYSLAGIPANDVTAQARALWSGIPVVETPITSFTEQDLRQLIGSPGMTVSKSNSLCTRWQNGKAYLRPLYQPFPHVHPPIKDHVLVYFSKHMANALFWVDGSGKVYAFHVGPS